ncbi:MAG: N-acyl homoserine lactonase family protein [Alphaproteobacteria bacterium]|jgi:glyoxylase-like metal-dependent hydrolase (beta-lactamase superfamily II)
MSLPVWKLYAFCYGRHENRMMSDTFIGGNPNELCRGLDYFMWAIVGDDRVIVVDTGFTEDKVKRLNRTWLADPIDLLAKVGIDAAEVDEVILTHAHFDHVGNLGRFPKAKFTIQDIEMQSITGRDMTHPFLRQAYHQEDVEALVSLLYAGRMKFIKGDGTYAPGIDYHLIGGHSRGQMALTVNTERGPVFLASDAIHLFQEVDEELPFIVFYDMAQMLEGYRTCADLAGERAFLVPGHDPIVTDIYPAAKPGLEGLVLDLGKMPVSV